MIKASALLSSLAFAAGPVAAAEGDAARSGRNCPLVLAAYAALDGRVAVEFRGDETRTFKVLVDGIGYRLESRHSPHDGVWFAPPPLGLTKTLQGGNVAVVTPQDTRPSRFPLSGADEPIERVLAACR